MRARLYWREFERDYERRDVFKIGCFNHNGGGVHMDFRRSNKGALNMNVADISWSIFLSIFVICGTFLVSKGCERQHEYMQECLKLGGKMVAINGRNQDTCDLNAGKGEK